MLSAQVAGPGGQDGPVLGFCLGQPAQVMQGDRAQVAAGQRRVVAGAKDARADGLDGAQLFFGLLELSLADKRKCATSPALQGLDMLGPVDARGDICDGLVLVLGLVRAAERAQDIGVKGPHGQGIRVLRPEIIGADPVSREGCFFGQLVTAVMHKPCWRCCRHRWLPIPIRLLR